MLLGTASSVSRSQVSEGPSSLPSGSIGGRSYLIDTKTVDAQRARAVPMRRL